MISLEHKFMFIHIPKTAGSSIEWSLKDYSEDNITERTPNGHGIIGVITNTKTKPLWKHAMLSDYNKHFDVNNYFKFTCVRNTWDRVMSWCVFHKNKIPNDKQLTQFIKGMKPHNHVVFNNQLNYISIDGKLRMDYIIRYENITSQFKDLCNKLNISPPPLSVINKSKNSTIDYRDHYSYENKDLVYKIFKEEIDYFDFEY